MSSDYSSLSGNKLSPYDAYIKKGAAALNWDWRLLASVIYQESNFQPNVRSWAGAVGLMQLMPETGRFFGVSNLQDPVENMNTGVRLLKYLDDYWIKFVPDSTARLKFVLASYNVGLSHVIDARKLSVKYNKDASKWEPVKEFLILKNDPKYYRDPVAVAGYCYCQDAVTYVNDVLQRFEEYKIAI